MRHSLSASEPGQEKGENSLMYFGICGIVTAKDGQFVDQL